MGVDHFAFEFARFFAVYDAEMKFRSNGNRFQRIEVTAVQAQFVQLRGN
jgi:hypothetical protein